MVCKPMKIIAFESVTLDGVMQAPGRPDEDRRGGFQHGGWALPYADTAAAGQSMSNTGALLLGRRTYQDFFSVWPNRTDNPFSEILNNAQKYVASKTLGDPLPWKNSTLIKGDAEQAVAKLRQQAGKDIVILGSGELVHSLMRRNLIDEYVLLIHPLILGSGRRLIPDDSPRIALQLTDSKTTPSGVVIATYRPADSATA
jgi:dihydrofolate reductase